MITSTADVRLNGSIRQMFLLTRRYRPPCTHTTTRYPSPRATPSLPWLPFAPNACGTDSPMTRNPAMPSNSSSRSGDRDGVRALVSHA